MKRFLLFHSGKHPCGCGEIELTSFLEHLSVDRKISGVTQALALNSLVFFFSRVLDDHRVRLDPINAPKTNKITDHSKPH
ncbi:MAG: site-specific integrase [Candidatus Thiodiazotropha sp. DIVDIV]